MITGSSSSLESVGKVGGTAPQQLLIDADDTLWENNIYFEQAVDAFVEFLDHSSMPADRIRLVLQEIEFANINSHGYGAAAFGQNLEHCYRRLSERGVCDDDISTILGFAEEILLQEIDLLPGVAETLPQLAARHQLVIFTKGREEEQRAKIEKSGIDLHFIDAIVVREKTVDVYEEVVARFEWERSTTWMVGNSPKSDINPALAAGLNAVFIPHERTWALEQQDLQVGSGRLLQLSAFSQLLDHF